MYFFPLSLGQEGQLWPLEQDLRYVTTELLFPPTPVTCIEGKKNTLWHGIPNSKHRSRFYFVLQREGSGLRKYLVFDLKQLPDRL